jgi:hypothetical protein
MANCQILVEYVFSSVEGDAARKWICIWYQENFLLMLMDYEIQLSTDLAKTCNSGCRICDCAGQACLLNGA